MSLDVSPDGRAITFELLGDLYTLPITGGYARRLTSGMAFNRDPHYSPDGQSLVFVSDRSGVANLWIMDRNGRNARRLSDLYASGQGGVTSPVWSPDGQSIVASQMLSDTRPGDVAPTQQFRWLLATYDVTTGRMRWLSDTAPNRTRPALGAAFGPRQDVVYAAMDSHRQLYVDNAEAWRIVRVELATGRIEPEMWSAAHRIGVRPALSRDGRYLAYATNTGSRMGLRLRDLRNNRERWLVRELLDAPPVFPAVEGRDLMPGYAFTPDSKAVIATFGGKIHRIDLASGHTSVIPFIADVERGLAPLTVHQFTLPDTAVRTRNILQVALSPDGRRAAFSALDRIWVMELPHNGRPAGRPRRLTVESVGEFYPSWSPDGRWIAYSTWEDREGGAVRRSHVSDGEGGSLPSERLTADTALYFHTAVSPSGDRVVAIRAPLPPERVLTPARDLDLTLAWVPSEGGMPRTITSLATERHGLGHPQYPADQLYFTAIPNRVYVGFASWNVVGSERQTSVVVSGSAEVQGVFSPDLRRALATTKSSLFELALPMTRAGRVDTLDLRRLRTEAFGSEAGAAHRWGTALAPWVSWSRDGNRVLFSQGGTLFVGDVRPGGWTSFTRVDVPLLVAVDVPRGTLVLRGARLITMRGREVIDRGDLVVRDNRIVAVGPTGSVVIPKAAHVLDVRGTTILPGYVDVHDHMWLPAGVHSQQCWRCLTMLAFGVTTGRDPNGSMTNDLFTYRERERSGDLLGPRIFSTGIPYFGTDPPIRTLDDARDAVLPAAEYFGAETFKAYVDFAGGRGTWQLLAMAVAESKLNATVHGMGIERDLTTIVDGYSGLEHAPLIWIYDDVATLIARSGTTYTQTVGSQIPGAWRHMFLRHGGVWANAKMRRFAPPAVRAFTCEFCTYYSGDPELDVMTRGAPELDQLLPMVSGAARIVAKGGRLGIGAHGDIPGLGTHYEMWLHALGGVPNQEILRSATIVGATAIGHSRDFGSLEPGKLADLQVLDRNPLENIHFTTSIRYVMKNGRMYHADDLTEVWPRNLALDARYVWDSAPSPGRGAGR